MFYLAHRQITKLIMICLPQFFEIIIIVFSLSYLSPFPFFPLSLPLFYLTFLPVSTGVQLNTTCLIEENFSTDYLSFIVYRHSTLFPFFPLISIIFIQLSLFPCLSIRILSLSTDFSVLSPSSLVFLFFTYLPRSFFFFLLFLCFFLFPLFFFFFPCFFSGFSSFPLFSTFFPFFIFPISRFLFSRDGGGVVKWKITS